MLVLALQFSRCAHTSWRPRGLRHDAALEPWLMLVVEGNSLKTEEKTKSVVWA